LWPEPAAVGFAAGALPPRRWWGTGRRKKSRAGQWSREGFLSQL